MGMHGSLGWSALTQVFLCARRDVANCCVKPSAGCCSLPCTCSVYGASTLEGWGINSFQQLYLRLLHPFGKYLGAWAGDLNPLGSCLLVYLDPPAIMGAIVSCLRFREPGRAPPS